MEKYIGMMSVNAEFAYSEPTCVLGLRFQGYNIVDKDGTKKWMSKSEFEKVFRPITDI